MTSPNRQIGFQWQLASYMRRGNFVVSECNQAALQWVEIWPQWGSYASVLWGPESCGKTHLAHIWSERSQAVFLNPQMPEQEFMDLALKCKSFIIDDADEFFTDPAVKNSRQALLLHALNSAKNNNGHLLMLAKNPTARWNADLPDLSSRLNALPQIEIFPPDEAMMAMLITKLFSDRQLLVEPGVIDYVTKRLHRSYAAAYEFVVMSDRFSLESGRMITVSLVREILSQLDERFSVS